MGLRISPSDGSCGFDRGGACVALGCSQEEPLVPDPALRRFIRIPRPSSPPMQNREHRLEHVERPAPWQTLPISPLRTARGADRSTRGLEPTKSNNA